MKFLSDIKVRCAFPMVVLSDFRLGKHRDDGHEEEAPYFKLSDKKLFL